MSDKYNRSYNFSPGPAAIPLEALEQARDELLNYKQSGMSVMEMSHRSKEFLSIIEEAEDNIRALLGITNDYSVIFLQGGASFQFCMVPMNLVGPDQMVDVIQTGSWTKKASKEIEKICKLHIAGSTEKENFMRIPKQEELNFSENPAYIHIASNNTIMGTQTKVFPETNEIPLVADMSSDILSRVLDISKFGLIFAGSQKNLGPAGICLVIIRNDLVGRSSSELPIFLQYKSHIDAKSLYNTPPTFSIYMLNLVTKWIKSQGGLLAIEKKNIEKATLLYECIEQNDFYDSPVTKEDRSNMNVVFRIKGAHENPKKEELEALFVQEALKNQIVNIKGHRSVGGLRASIYNAMSKEVVQHLVDFMTEFAKMHSV